MKANIKQCMPKVHTSTYIRDIKLLAKLPERKGRAVFWELSWRACTDTYNMAQRKTFQLLYIRILLLLFLSVDLFLGKQCRSFIHLTRFVLELRLRSKP